MLNVNIQCNLENESLFENKSIAALTSVTLAATQAYIGGFNLGTYTAISLAGFSVFEALSDIFSFNHPKIPSGILPDNHSKIPLGKIKNGYGEFIVYRDSPEKQQVSEETYNQVYDILKLYTYSQIAEDNESESISEICKNRHKIIRNKIQEIDPSLKIVFIPRALYELIFIKKSIAEEVKHGNTRCPNIYKKGYLSPLNKGIGIPTREKCWHINSFPNAGSIDDPNVRKVAFWLNKTIFKSFKKSLSWEFSDILQMTEKYINYFKNYGTKQPIRCEDVRAVDFFHQLYGEVDNMHEPEERTSNIIRNAVAIECSEVAQTSFLLYRGSQIENDHPFNSEETGFGLFNSTYAHSLSYGTGLFAGYLRDKGAMAFGFAVTKGNCTYVTPVPVEKANEGPFFIPQKTHVICQLSAYGENFHARSKAWKNFDLKKMSGTADYNDERGYLASELSRDELISEFYDLKSKIIKI